MEFTDSYVEDIKVGSVKSNRLQRMKTKRYDDVERTTTIVDTDTIETATIEESGRGFLVGDRLYLKANRHQRVESSENAYLSINSDSQLTATLDKVISPENNNVAEKFNFEPRDQSFVNKSQKNNDLQSQSARSQTEIRKERALDQKTQQRISNLQKASKL